jgi:hypothetical protein
MRIIQAGRIGLLAFVTLTSLALAQGERVFEKTGGFSYVLLKGWSVREVLGFKYRFVFGPASNGFAPNINFVDEAYTGALAEYVRLSKNGLAGAGLKYTFVTEKAFATDHVGQAVRLETNTEQQGRKLHQVFYFLDAKTRKFVVTCTRLMDQPAVLNADCDAVVKTFKLEP